MCWPYTSVSHNVCTLGYIVTVGLSLLTQFKGKKPNGEPAASRDVQKLIFFAILHQQDNNVSQVSYSCTAAVGNLTA